MFAVSTRTVTRRPGPVGDRVSLRTAGPADDDVLVARRGVRDIEMEGLRLVAAGRDRVRDAGWDVTQVSRSTWYAASAVSTTSSPVRTYNAFPSSVSPLLSPVSNTGKQPSARRLRGAALPLGVLVSGRRVAAGRARGACSRARIRGARAHGPRRPLRLARVRACGEALRRAPDHRRRGHAQRRRLDGAAHERRCRLCRRRSGGRERHEREARLCPRGRAEHARSSSRTGAATRTSLAS